MSNLLNYERGETLATGFVRPKVTSLFFDKIWLPEEVLDSSFEFKGIPQEVLILQNKHKKRYWLNSSPYYAPALISIAS